MERYMVFGGKYGYYGGGMHDFVGSFMFINDAVLEMKRKEEPLNKYFFYDWAHIYDLIECEIINEL